MLPEDRTVDVVPIDEEEHEYGVQLRNAKPVVAPQTELKMEAARKETDVDEEKIQDETKKTEDKVEDTFRAKTKTEVD